MTEMTTNITDHSRSMFLAATSPTTSDVTEKYANVKSPVVAIPTLRMRAPRPYPEPPPLEADKQHGPRERGASLHDRPVARQQRDEAPLGPVVQVPGRVAEVLPVRPARHVQPAPQRLARDRDEQVPRGHARHLGDGVRGVGHVLEHLDRRRDVELAVAE